MDENKIFPEQNNDNEVLNTTDSGTTESTGTEAENKGLLHGTYVDFQNHQRVNTPVNPPQSQNGGAGQSIYNGYNANGYNANGYNANGYNGYNNAGNYNNANNANNANNYNNANGYNGYGYNANPYSNGNPGSPNGTYTNYGTYGSYTNGTNGMPPNYRQQMYRPPVQKKPSNAWKVWTAILCVFCLCTSLIVATVYSSRFLGKKIDSGGFHFKDSAEVSGEDGTLGQLQNSSYQSVADIAEDVGKSVVTITTALSVQDGFFSVDAEALGSGIIIGEQNDKIYIATNYHVIEGASAVSVIVGEDETTAISAYHQGSDEDSDLAVIYIRKSDVPEEVLKEIKIATLGQSSELRLGDLAIAIGSPVDKSFGNTVTVGTISGLERSVTFTDDNNVSSTLVLLQTDAAINPGNSGGALVNGRGEIIGINNAKIVDTDVERMGFAIPIDTAKPILETLINEGKIVRPYIGIMGYNVEDSQELQQYHLLSGIFVQSVTSGSPAYYAGIREYDVIVSFNGVTINNFDDLKGALDGCTIGQTVEVEVLRGYLDNEPTTVTLQLKVEDKNA